MLQQTFTPLYKQATTPVIVETPQITVKYPLLYRVTKDNQVHHLLGHIHAIPLSFMPDYVLDIIKQSDLLFTEGFATLPPEFLASMISENAYYEGFTNSFIKRLREDVKAHFHKDILELLDIFSVPNSQALKLDNLASTFLSTLFGMLISKRIDSEQLIIDTALVKLFKEQAKTIVELNEASKIQFIDHCQSEESKLKAYLACEDETYRKTTTRLISLANNLNNHYQHTNIQDHLQIPILKNFIENDVTYNNSDDFEPHLTKAENAEWLKIFLRQHHQGTNNMLLACGYAHLLHPEYGLLQLLANEGFSIEKVYDLENAFKHKCIL